MEPTIITKKFLLAGYEVAIDLRDDFGGALGALQARLLRNLDGIGHRDACGRPVGFWTGDPSVDYGDAQNHSKRVYFFGVEVSQTDDLPADCVVRDFPESAFAVFREEERGTAPKWEWLKTSGYQFNAAAVPGDLEIFDDFEHTRADCPCDILVPLRR